MPRWPACPTGACPHRTIGSDSPAPGNPAGRTHRRTDPLAQQADVLHWVWLPVTGQMLDLQYLHLAARKETGARYSLGDLQFVFEWILLHQAAAYICKITL